jgi:ectoine hydroxylase-related dioxygenase (phytanoyl-CoA dioxygenase family)
MGLTSEQVRLFREEGVLVAEGVLQDDDLTPLIAAYSRWIDRKARSLKEAGKVEDLHSEEPFDRRIALLYAQSPDILQGLDLMEARLPEALDFMRNDHLLNAVESLIGPEITCSPIQHIRAKPPGSISGDGPGFFNVPWHQDAGVTWEEADNSDIITCWVPLVDATVENGCMEVLPGVWKQGYREHQAEGGTTIRPDLMPETSPRPVPVRKGGVIFMHRHTPHRSIPNQSDHVRWSVDLRYQPTGTPTGRPFHPDFVARSQKNPDSVLTDPEEWGRRWIEAFSDTRKYQAHRVK